MLNEEIKDLDNKFVSLGKFGRAHGVNGGIKFYSYTDPSVNVFNYSLLYIKKSVASGKCFSRSSFKRLSIINFKPSGVKEGCFFVKIDGCIDRSAAILYTDKEIYTLRSEFKEPDKDIEGYYLADLENISVFDDEGNYVGKTDYWVDLRSSYLLRVTLVNNKHLFIPFIKDCVLHVDLSASKMIVSKDFLLID